MVSMSKKCFDGYMGQLKTIYVLWLPEGLVEDHKSGFCGHQG